MGDRGVEVEEEWSRYPYGQRFLCHDIIFLEQKTWG